MNFPALSGLGTIFLFLLLLGCQSSAEPRSEAQPTVEPRAEQSASSTEAAEERAQPRSSRQRQEMDPELAQRQSDQVSDEDLERFAAGVKGLKNWETRLIAEGRDLDSRSRGASNPVEVVQAREEIIREMEAVLQNEGLDPDRFMEVGQFIRANPLLLERLRGFLSEEEMAYFFGV